MCLRLKKPTIIIEYKENLEKGSLFLYITFWETLWINNIKLITIILLAFTIPFSGYGQLDDDPLTHCTRPMPFWFGFGGGINSSKVDFKEFSTEYLYSSQISFEIKSQLYSYVRNPKGMFLFGLSYDSKKYNILNSKNKEIELRSSYLTIPIKYQYNIIDLDESIPLSVLLGGFYSLKLDENSIDKDIVYLPGSNYGVIVGSKIEYYLNTGIYVFIEYNFQFGFASIENTVSNSGNVSHLINIGFKFP